MVSFPGSCGGLGERSPGQSRRRRRAGREARGNSWLSGAPVRLPNRELAPGSPRLEEIEQSQLQRMIGDDALDGTAQSFADCPHFGRVRLQSSLIVGASQGWIEKEIPARFQILEP